MIFNQLSSLAHNVKGRTSAPKSDKPEILSVAMLTTYKVDMAMTLEHMARSEGMPTTYDDTSKEAKAKEAKKVAKARAKRRLEEGEEDGPPDKHQHFQSDKPSRSIALVQSALVY